MSALCAILHETGSPSPALLERMAAAGAPPGTPAEPGFEIDGRAGLGWCAAPAREAAGGRADGGEPLLLAADARLDNRAELADLLLPERGGGDPPSDRELLAAAYRRWGADCPRHLLGDFAFAVWDSPRRRLFCARDPMGVKPLAWSRTGSALCVASRARQIAVHPELDHTLDDAYLGRYLAAALPEPDETPLRSIRRLPPAHTLTAEAGRVEIRRAWQPDLGARIHYRRTEEYAEHLDELLRSAVADRLRDAGAAVGIQLSGGLDSGAVAAALAEESRRLDPPPRLLALSACFEAVEECDERQWIDAVVERLGLEPHVFYPERSGLLAPAEDLPFDLDSPFVGWAGVETAMLERLRDAGGRVVLTGHGGDSILYGSPLLYADLLRHGRLWAAARDLRRHSRDREVPLWRLAYLYLAKPLLPEAVLRTGRRLAGRSASRRPPAWLTPRLVAAAGLDRRIERIDRLLSRAGAREALAREATFLGDIWTAIDWLDRLAGAHGIEARHPLLDRRIVEFAVAVPPEQHYRAGLGKRLLRAATAGRLPDEVRERRTKTLFRPFLDHCLLGRERERLAEVVVEPRLGEIGAVDVDRLRSAMESYLDGRDPGFGIYAQRVASLERWLTLFPGRPEAAGDPEPSARDRGAVSGRGGVV